MNVRGLVEVDASQVRRTTSQLGSALFVQRTQEECGLRCWRLVRSHLLSLGANKRGWPTTRFYPGASRGTTWSRSGNSITVSVDNARHPGAMRQRYHGGEIRMKDKLLTIPAAPQFYGRAATEFTGLRFAVLGGKKALIVSKEGASAVNFNVGTSRAVAGASARRVAGLARRGAVMVAYWLRERVWQEQDPGVLPTDEEFVGAVEAGVDAVLMRAEAGGLK